jgi:hypothetical protein
VPPEGHVRTQNGWEWLANAEKWHHLANLEIISHFEDCNITKPNGALGSNNPEVECSRWETIAAA